MIRTGAEYVERLRNTPREVWVRGRRVADVTAHPAFARPVEQIAKLYDMQHDPRHRAVLTRPGPAGRVGVGFVPPRSHEDLVARRAAFRLWSEATLGLMGRTPDFLNCILLAFAEEPGVFAKLGKGYADNVGRYFSHVRDNDLFLTHALITPQVDRSKTSAQQADTFLHMGVVEENDRGIVVRGARMLATLAPLADEMLIYNMPGLRPGDERHAAVFAVPIETPGLRLITRELYDDGSRNSFDHPLAANFEEPDCLVVFDDVLVPWERVFLLGDVELANALPKETRLTQFTGHQTGTRGLVKMELVTQVMVRFARSVKIDSFLHVQRALGEALAATDMCRALLVAAEIEHETTPGGTVRPALDLMQTLRLHLSAQYPKLVETLQTLGAGGLLMMPTAADFGSDVASDIHKYLQGAGGLAGMERVRLNKLVWDLCGDAFGQRAVQYERYYAGDPVRLSAAKYLSRTSGDAERLVERALALSGDPAEALAATPLPATPPRGAGHAR